MYPPLTHQEATLRSATVEPLTCAVQLWLAAVGESFRSRSEIVFRSRKLGATTFVECRAADVRSATLNGRPVGTPADGRLRLPDLQAENVLVVDADMPYSDTGFGMQRWSDPADGAVYAYTHLQPAHAGSVFACFDQPDLKTSVTTTVTAPAEWTVVSNSPGVRHPISAVAHEHRFSPTGAMSSYLFSVVAGPLAYWRRTARPGGPALGVYARRSLAEHVDAETLLDQTEAGLAYFTDLFGVAYPHPKHDLCFVPDLAAGAMENVGCVTASEVFVFRRRVTRAAYRRRCEMVLHELSHQWFGNLVTPRWWDDLWLNEAFATWASLDAQVAVTEFTDAWTGFAVTKKATAYEQDALPTTHPVVGSIADAAAAESGFDRITYAKGAGAIRQLAALIGAEAFRSGLRTYIAEHAFGNAVTDDLLRALSTASGRDLREWAQAWLRSAGVTAVSVEAGETPRTLVVRQAPPVVGDGPPRPHRLAIGFFAFSETAALERVGRIEVELPGAAVTVRAPDISSDLDLVLPNDGDLTYCAVELDDRSLATVAEGVGRVVDPGARSLCWAALWDATRAGRLPALGYLDAVVRWLRQEPEIAVVQRALRQVARVLLTYADPGQADRDGWPVFAGWLIETIEAPGTAPDVRLAATRALAASACSGPQLATIRSWLRRGAAGALDLDLDLRRRLLGGLLAHGTAEPRAVAAELWGDPAADAVFGDHEATLRALVGSPRSKDDAWSHIVGGDEPAARSAARVAGFVHPAQRSQLAPFAHRYVTELPDLWARRGEAARGAAVGLFPLWSVDRPTLALVDEMLGRDLPNGLRRVVMDGQAELARGVELQESSRAGRRRRASAGAPRRPDAPAAR